ncbi:MAG: hypothetical protein L7U52_07585 [Alphaproteobacteria bacterium]|nr:hypothetical protein [Alphaproteobacteria bacterium]
MSLEQGFNIVDNALNLAVSDLEQRGMPKDDAYIALLLRLRNVISPDVVKVADLLSDDAELNDTINQNSVVTENAGTHY